MSVGNIFRNLLSRGTKDILNKKTWSVVSEWADIKAEGLTIPANEIQSFAEQVVYRLHRCQPCVSNGECVHCHCSMPAKALTPLAECSDGRWPSVKSPQDWEKYKIEKNIEIIVLQP